MLTISGPGATRTGAANHYEIMSLATLKVLLTMATGTADDTVLQKLLDGVHQAAWKHMGERILKYNVGVPWVQIYSGQNNRVLRLRQWPIVALTTLEHGWIVDSSGAWTAQRAYTTGEYIIDSDHGVVRAINGAYFPAGEHNLKVSYTSGYATGQEPADLQRALADWVGVCLKRIKDRSWDVSSTAANDQQRTFTVDEMPRATEAVLDRYRRMEAFIA